MDIHFKKKILLAVLCVFSLGFVLSLTGCSIKSDSSNKLNEEDIWILNVQIASAFEDSETILFNIMDDHTYYGKKWFESSDPIVYDACKDYIGSQLVLYTDLNANIKLIDWYVPGLSDKNENLSNKPVEPVEEDSKLD